MRYVMVKRNRAAAIAVGAFFTIAAAMSGGAEVHAQDVAATGPGNGPGNGGVDATALAAASDFAPSSDTVLVQVDQASIVRLDEPAASIIVGNPMIADAAIYDRKTLVVTGKSYGTTNLIVLSKEGREIVNRNLQVRYGAQSQLTIQRGTGRHSYTCAPNCEPVLVVGDSQPRFEALKDNIDARLESVTKQATGQ